MGSPLDARAQKAFKVLCLPARDILFMNSRLIFDKQIELGLRHRVTLEVDLELVRRLQLAFSRRIDGTLDIAVLCLMDRRL